MGKNLGQMKWEERERGGVENRKVGGARRGEEGREGREEGRYQVGKVRWNFERFGF